MGKAFLKIGITIFVFFLKVYDFIEDINNNNLTTSYAKSNAHGKEHYGGNNNMERIFSNIQSRVNTFTKWKSANEKGLNEWLNKKLKRTNFK